MQIENLGKTMSTCDARLIALFKLRVEIL